MKFLLALVVSALFFIGCSDDKPTQNVQAKLTVGASLQGLTLPDQYEKPQTIPQDTKIIFFSFSKEIGHSCNDFLAKQPSNYLPSRHAVYVADISAAPGIIKSMFIKKDLKKLPFSVLIIDDDTLSAKFQKGQNTDTIVAAILNNGTIERIENLKTTAELQKLIEAR